MRIRLLFNLLTQFFMVGFLALALVGFVVYEAIHKPLPVSSSEGYIILISPGMSVQKITEKLRTDHILEHPTWFKIWLSLSGNWSKIKAGEYQVKPGMSAKNMMDLFVSGKVMQHPFTIVEGWNFAQMMEALNQNEFLNHSLVTLSPQEIMQKIGQNGIHPEGRFYPETYFFPRGTSDITFLRRAYQKMEEKLQQAWLQRNTDLPLKSPQEVLTLASIIEKESSVIDEYKEIAGVYIRRLQKKMLLQADPTVIYGMVALHSGRQYSDTIKSSDLTNTNPYNTYVHVGLPPTPIAMPSGKALIAATQPSRGETLYFVAEPQGKGHVFSKTIEEHNQAVARYRSARKAAESAVDPASVSDSVKKDSVKAVDPNKTPESSSLVPKQE